MLLRDLQMLGHQIVVIIGDFTAETGDTSDKDCERPAISGEAVLQNMQTYIQQIGRILDLDKTEFHFNKEWWSKMNFSHFVSML
jgi:tyrosyl-tRNA synthetase